MTGRENIFAVLFTLLQTIPGVVSFSRRIKDLQMVPPEQQPAVFLTQGKQTATTAHTGGRLTKWELEGMITIYVNAGGDPDAVTSTPLNMILDGIDGVMSAFQTQKQNLGGSLGIYEARISGAVEIYEGPITGQGVAIVPIRIISSN